MIKKMKAVSIALSLSMVVAFTAPVSASHFYEMGIPSEKAMSLIERDILVGYEDESLGLGDNITRSEFSAIAARSIGLFNKEPASVNINIEDRFSDVLNGRWYSESLAIAIQEGVINGYTDGTFKPEANVTNQEVLTMMVRMATSKEQRAKIDAKGNYPLNYINAARDLGLLKDSKMTDFQETATRGHSLNIAFNAITAIEKTRAEADKDEVVEGEDDSEEFAIEGLVVNTVRGKSTVKVLKDKEEQFDKEIQVALKDAKDNHVYKIILTKKKSVKSVKDITKVETGVVSQVAENTIEVDGKQFKFSEDTLILENNRKTARGVFKNKTVFEGQIVVHDKEVASVNMFRYDREGMVVSNEGSLDIVSEGEDNPIYSSDKDLNVLFINEDGVEKGLVQDLKEDDYLYISSFEMEETDVLVFRNSERGILTIVGETTIHESGNRDLYADINFESNFLSPSGGKPVQISDEKATKEKEIGDILKNILLSDSHREEVGKTIDATILKSEDLRANTVEMIKDAIAIYDLKGNIKAVRTDIAFI